MILLNSDTVVSPGWVNRLIACAESDPRIGLVGPLSNTASWQSIPDVRLPDGEWAENPLGEGTTPEDMARSVARSRAGSTPVSPSSTGSAC